MHKVEKELTAVTKVSRKGDEPDQTYFERLFEKVNSLPDDNWETLSEEAKIWANSVSDILGPPRKKEPLPNFDGEVPEKDASPKKTKSSGKAAKTTKATKDVASEKASKKGAPVATKGAAKAKAPSKTEEKAETRGRKAKYEPSAKISVKAEENPHRKSSKDYAKFAKLKNGMTVQKALDGGIDRGYLRYVVDRDLVSIA